MKTILAIVQMIPALIEIIKKVEELLPESGAGKDKLGLVQNMLEAAYSGVSDMWPQIEKIVGIVVTFCNKFGIFKSAQAVLDTKTSK